MPRYPLLSPSFLTPVQVLSPSGLLPLLHSLEYSGFRSFEAVGYQELLPLKLRRLCWRAFFPPPPSPPLAVNLLVEYWASTSASILTPKLLITEPRQQFSYALGLVLNDESAPTGIQGGGPFGASWMHGSRLITISGR